MPPRLRQIAIEGFRSIEDQIVIDFPENQPLVLIGENNSGKSNIIRAIELMFGEFHPKFKKLDDYDKALMTSLSTQRFYGSMQAFQHRKQSCQFQSNWSLSEHIAKCCTSRHILDLP